MSRRPGDGNAPSGTEEIPSIPEWDSEPEPVESVSRKAPEEVEFLGTDFELFDKWLNERFRVDYKHMSPQLIFDQVPLNDIYYETVALPEKPPAFHLKSSDISRRELLQKIAEFWDLEMSIVTDESGQPTAVQISAPGFYR